MCGELVYNKLMVFHIYFDAIAVAVVVVTAIIVLQFSGAEHSTFPSFNYYSRIFCVHMCLCYIIIIIIIIKSLLLGIQQT